MIRVVVVDDEELVRSGLRLILGAAPDIEVVADCGGGDAVATVLAHRPDVLLLDVRMPDVDGLTVLRQLHAPHPDGLGDLSDAPRTAMLTTFDAEEYLETALQEGAAGFLLKDTAPEQLVHAVRVLADGGRVLAPGVTPAVIGGYLGRKPDQGAVRDVAALTVRERQVLALVGEGLSNGEIARRLRLAHGTVKDHVSALLAKLGGLNRVRAAVVADRAGLVGHLSPHHPGAAALPAGPGTGRDTDTDTGGGTARAHPAVGTGSSPADPAGTGSSPAGPAGPAGEAGGRTDSPGTDPVADRALPESSRADGPRNGPPTDAAP